MKKGICILAFTMLITGGSSAMKLKPLATAPIPILPRPTRSAQPINTANNGDMDKSETFWYGYQPSYYNYMNPLMQNDFYYRGYNQFQYNPYGYMPPYYSNPYYSNPYYF